MMKTGLLGYPIGHSLSPAIHNAAYRALGLDWEYALYPCEDQAAFEATVAKSQANSADWVGFNVTTPYKVAAFNLCDTRSPAAMLTSNANVLTFSPSTSSSYTFIHGDNTDGRGLVAALEREAGCSLTGSSVVICGSGAVAHSTLPALFERKVASVTVASRNPQRALEHMRKVLTRYKKLRGILLLPVLRAVGYDEIATSLAAADVLIDATTVGMHPGDAPVVAPEALHPGLIVYDVVYGHGETALIRAAREIGAKAFDGLGMLIEQAALTIEIWGRAQGGQFEVPRDLMRRVALNHLTL